MHVKGFTRLCPDVPEELRGTYAGVGSAAAIKYLKELGVTAVELLPVHAFVHDKILSRQRPDQLLGLQLDRLLRAGSEIFQQRRNWASR